MSRRRDFLKTVLSGVTFQCGTQQRSSFYYRHAAERIRAFGVQ